MRRAGFSQLGKISSGGDKSKRNHCKQLCYCCRMLLPVSTVCVPTSKVVKDQYHSTGNMSKKRQNSITKQLLLQDVASSLHRKH